VLWKVLKEDMSLVGRGITASSFMDCLPLYTQEQAQKHEDKAGIVGRVPVKCVKHDNLERL